MEEEFKKLELNEASSSGSFFERSANMTKVWELITSELSGLDVARCLKVCRGMRLAIAQCLQTNTKLRRKLDAEATVIEAMRSSFSSTTTVNTGDRKVFVLDDTWYFEECGRTGKVGTRRLCPDTGETIDSTVNLGKELYFQFVIMPTMNPDKVLAVTSKMEKKMEGEEDRGHFEVLQEGAGNDLDAMTRKYCTEYFPSAHCLVRYRIFVQRRSYDTFDLIMILIGNDGKMIRKRRPFMLRREVTGMQCEPHDPDRFFNVMHRPSQDQVPTTLDMLLHLH